MVRDQHQTHRPMKVLTHAMLILAGTAMARAEYGKPLTALQTLDAPGVMDAAVSGNHLFFVGHRFLWVADLADPSNPRVAGKAQFHGGGRQITVQDDVAFVTARSEGVYIVDVSDASRPRVLSHYDTIELATGIDVHGDILLIAERHYGVELVDVSDPKAPKFISKVRTNEAQSVAVHGRYAYAGDWAKSQVTAIDISNPKKPRVTSISPLDGFGDGVYVQDGYLYASTGNHARGGQNNWLRRKDEPGYGEGHGFEVFSLADPAKPAFVSRLKFRKFYRRGAYDTWTTVVSGSYAFCADTDNGVFVVDISDPQSPNTVARYHELVGGLAVGNGHIYAACPEKGLVVLDARDMARPAKPDKGERLSIPPHTLSRPDNHRIYRPGGQIRSLDFVGDYAVVAAGMHGAQVVKLWPEVEEVFHIETEGFALHVDTHGNRIYVSEGPKGLSIWEHAGDGRFRLLGRYEEPNHRPIIHTLVEGQSRYAVAESAHRFYVIDVSNPAKPRQILERRVAIVYGDQTSHGLVAGRYMCVSDHRTPLRWLDVRSKDPERVDTGVDLAEKLGFFEGAASLEDRLLVTSHGGYYLAKPLSTNLEKTPLYRCEKSLRGKPRVHGRGLFLLSRNHSQVMIVDLLEAEEPRFLGTIDTKGNPGDAIVKNGALIIADGYNGLLIYDDFVKTLSLDVTPSTFLPDE